MAKLNYANRKSEGVKLAQIVAKDLRKKASASPSKSDHSPIELNLDGKAVCDEGIREISAALVEVLRKAHAEHRPNCQLGELHLPNNNISALGLQYLAPAIQLAGPWLKDVDVSYNLVSVSSAEQCAAWERFLDSFGTCRGLRRLDLSNNDLSGTHAFELLTRVYFRHAPYDPAAARQVDIKMNALGDTRVSELTAKINSFGLADEATVDSYNEGCGLRYVPYLVCSNVNMEDAGCFQLSYILSRHVEPQHLLEPMKAGPAKQQLEDYDHKSGCSGIIYTTTKLTPYGSKLLEDCERQREDLVRAEIKEEAVESSEKSSPPRDERPPTPPSAYASMLAPRHKHGTPRRRSSIVSSDSTDAMSSPLTARKGSTFDAESVLWKLQRETIEKHGMNNVELWRIAMRLLTVARAILPPTKSTKSIIPSNAAASAPARSTAIWKASMYAPAKQKRQDSAVSSDQTEEQQQMTTWRDPHTPHQLPLEIWRSIMMETADPSGILSEVQVESVLEYAADRATLAKEKESVRNPISNQQWMVLHAMGCLAYDMPL